VFEPVRTRPEPARPEPVRSTGGAVGVRPYIEPTPTRAPAPEAPPPSSPGTSSRGAPLPASSTSGRIVPADSQAPIDSPRFRAAVPRSATELVSTTSDPRAPRFRSALERLATPDAGSPSSARLSDAMGVHDADRTDVAQLLARYRASNRDDADLRAALARISAPLSTGRPAIVERPGGGSVDYARGPLRRLSDPRGGEGARRAAAGAAAGAPPEGTFEERLRHANAGGADVSGFLEDDEIGPTRATLAASGDASLGLGVEPGIVATGSDFVPVQHVHHHVKHYHTWSTCWYGTSWWYKPWGFGLYFGWPSYCYGYEPLWLHHPVYGVYPWYGGYAFGYCGASNWYFGSYGSWSWGLSSYYGPAYVHPTVVVVDDEPDVVVVERVVEQPVVVEQPAPAEAAAELVPVPAFDVAAEPRAIGPAADRYLTLGDRAFRDARFADAVHYYTKAVALEPDEPVLQLLLSDALFATGDYAAAAAALRKALAGDPMLVRSEVDKREFYSEKRAFDRQLAVCELYLADHPVDSDARLVLAVNLLFSGAPASAVDLLESDLAFGLRDDPVARLVLETARERQYGPSAALPATVDDSDADR
jgi:hypothetical protein